MDFRINEMIDNWQNICLLSLNCYFCNNINVFQAHNFAF